MNEAPAPIRSQRQIVHRIVALSAALAAIAAGAAFATPDAVSSARPAPWWVALLVVVAYVAAEQTVFHLEFRREAISFSLSEVPTVAALIFLAPGPAIAARVVGSIVAIAIVRRSPVFKLLFNAALFAAELGIAFQMVRLVTSRWESDTALILSTIPAVAVATVAGSLFVSIAISLVEGGFLARMRDELKLSSWMAPLSAIIAAAVVAPLLLSPWLALVSASLVVAMWAVLRSYGRLGQRYRDLSALHGFVGQIGRSLDIHEIVDAAARETARLLRADQATVMVFEGTEGPVRCDVGEPLPDLPERADDPRWARVLAGHGAQLIGADALTSLGLPELAPTGGLLVVPVREAGVAIGIVALAARGGAEKRFGRTDAARLATLSEQLAPSLSKAKLHQRIEFEARHDGLTGLPNRSAFERAAAAMIDATRPSDGELAVMMLDLDRFKEVNDTLGHLAGDRLLVEFATRMQALVDDGDVFARFAGDEFALLARRPDLEAVQAVARACVAETLHPFSINGLEVVLTMSMGVATRTAHGDDAPTLMRRADIAMYTAKSQHTGFELYREEIDRRTPARLSMLGDLRAALENDDLKVYLQPKLDLATGIVIGVEALARWDHPTRGEVPPEEFVPVAEETGLIKQLTEFILSTSIDQLEVLRAHGHHLGLAVNLSTHDLLDELLPDRVMRHLDRHGLDPTILTLEITESSLLVDAPRARTTIDRLHRNGVRLAVDDFGTGYSSLSYLRNLPVSELKIDRSFVANVLLDEQDEVIVHSIVELGHNLGLQVVAEGVETDEVINRLRSYGCDVVQGYGVCRALPLEQFLVWLGATQHPSRRRDPNRPVFWQGDPTQPVVEPPQPGI